MITITNLQSKNDAGFTVYSIGINNKHITNFLHKPEDGLAVCLYLASEALRTEDPTRIKNNKKIANYVFTVMDDKTTPNTIFLDPDKGHEGGIIIIKNMGNKNGQ